jgi:hypothetical protein
MLGSFTTTSSLWIMRVLAVPRSMAISWVKKLNKPILKGQIFGYEYNACKIDANNPN